jgi:hypothetical protein
MTPNAVASTEAKVASVQTLFSEPENQSNLEMNALWNHFVFPVIGTAKRAFIFNLSAISW